MRIERTDKEILIKLSPDLDNSVIDRVIKYIEYLEMASSKATQQDADQLAEELNKNWWEENRKRFFGEGNR